MQQVLIRMSVRALCAITFAAALPSFAAQRSLKIVDKNAAVTVLQVAPQTGASPIAELPDTKAMRSPYGVALSGGVDELTNDFSMPKKPYSGTDYQHEQHDLIVLASGLVPIGGGRHVMNVQPRDRKTSSVLHFAFDAAKGPRNKHFVACLFTNQNEAGIVSAYVITASMSDRSKRVIETLKVPSGPFSIVVHGGANHDVRPNSPSKPYSTMVYFVRGDGQKTRKLIRLDGCRYHGFRDDRAHHD